MIHSLSFQVINIHFPEKTLIFNKGNKKVLNR